MMKEANMEDKIKQQLELVRQERESYLRLAERQVAMFDGAIKAYEMLLVQDDNSEATGG